MKTAWVSPRTICVLVMLSLGALPACGETDTSTAAPQTDTSTASQDVTSSGIDASSDAGAEVDTSPPGPTEPASPSAESAKFIQSRLAQLKAPGFASCVVRGGEIAWCGGYGLARLRTAEDEAVKVTKDTAFLLASVSKTVVATAFMALVDEGVVSLDSAINDNPAGLSITLPNVSSQQPIRYLDLLTHTAGISDNWSLMAKWYSDGSDSDLALKDVVTGYFSPGGGWYNAAANFNGKGPGITWEYANMGTTLLGYLIETLAKQDFGELCRERIFAPLGMTRTSWYLKDFEDPGAQLAMPYKHNNAKFTAAGHYTFADYPSGALRSSAWDMARFLQLYLAGGSLDGVDVLKPTTVTLMTKPAVPKVKADQAIQWTRKKTDGQVWISHGGSESGVTTEVEFNPQTGVGLVMLFNGRWSGSSSNAKLFSEIRAHVLAQAAKARD